MSCSSCKGANKVPTVSEDSSLSSKVLLKNYIIKVFVFLIMMILMPVIVIAISVILFRSIVLSKHVDVIPALRHVIKKLGEKSDTEDDEDYYDSDDDDYEPIDVEKIKEEK